MPADPKTQPVGDSTKDIIQALTQYLPGYMNVVNSQVGPQAQAELDSSKNISPQYSQLMQDLYAKFAPQMAQTGAQVENINRMGAASTDLSILQGPGGQLATQAQTLDKQLNPEYYATRSAAAGKLADLLGSISLNNPNPEAERLVSQESARSGNLGTPSSTETVANALSFGNEAMKRRAALGQAINVASGFLQPSQGQFNPIQTALNRPSTNTGESRFAGVQQPGSQAYQSGSNLLGSATSLQNKAMDINSQRRDLLDRMNETVTGVGSIVSI